MAINSFPSQWIVPDGVSVAFGSAPVAVVVDDLDEAQPNTIAMINKIAANFLKITHFRPPSWITKIYVST
jgi:hypothetical protein